LEAMNARAIADRARRAEIAAARQEIQAADALAKSLPEWATKPDLLALIQRDPKRLVVALAALEAMRTDRATPRHDRKFIHGLMSDLEALA
jgi:hypothetical protein